MKERRPRHSNVRREKRDLEPRPVMIAMLAVLAGIVVLVIYVTMIQVGPRGLFRNIKRPLLRQYTIFQSPPAEPVLETKRGMLLKEVRKEEEDALGGYGWVDRSRGIAHVPIEEAIGMMTAQGLPARAAGGPAAQSPPARAPGGPATQSPPARPETPSGEARPR